MPRPLTPLPEDLEVFFAARTARERGVPPSRLSGADIEHPFHGVYRRRDGEPKASGGIGPSLDPRTGSAEWRRRQLRNAQTLAPFLPPGFFFCGRTAAVIWRLPVPAARSEDLEVACFSPGRALRMRGVRGSRIDPRLAGITRRHGLPVTDAATTWCLLAPGLAVRDGVALGDAAIRRPRIPGTRRLEREPYATPEDLERATMVPFRRRRPALLGMLPLLSTQSASAPETHLRLMLQEWGLPELTLDFDVRGERGELLGCSEMVFREFRLACEYEGDHHRIETVQWNRDIQKYRDYARAGWDAIRVTSDLLYRRRNALRGQILDALVQRGWVPSP